MFKSLESERLIIRPLKLEDTKRIFTLSQEKGLGQWIPDQVYQDEEEAGQVISYLISQYVSPLRPCEKPLVLAVVLKEGNRLIGHIGLSPCDDGESAEIGYGIGERFIGRGYATEAVRNLCHWAVINLRLEKIQGIVASENISSYRVLEKAGFHKQKELEMNYIGSRRACRVYSFTQVQSARLAIK